MERKKVMAGLSAAAAMCILILDSRTAVMGCEAGLSLCVKTVIPSLFPFFCITGVLNSTMAGFQIRGLDSVCGFWGYPSGSAGLWISSVLGGYPSGAHALGLAYRSGALPKEEAQRLLPIGNNAGPAFIFGLAGQMFPGRLAPWALWTIQLTGAALVSRILVSGEHRGQLNWHPDKKSYSIKDAIDTMLQVCAWIILFRMGLEYIRKLISAEVPTALMTVLTGLLELSNGCCMLLTVENIKLRFVLCSGMLSFGGLCVAMQTVSAARGLSLKYYVPGKLLQSAFSIVLSAAAAYAPLTAVPCGIVLFLITGRKSKNYGGNTEVLRV